jgi:hypothetical protein
MARPKLPIDEDQVFRLAVFGCTNREIASFFDCSTDTIERRFAAQMDKGRMEGRTRLRRKIWQEAIEKGNTALLIFLAKNELGMSDKSALELSGVAGGPIELAARPTAELFAEMEDLKATWLETGPEEPADESEEDTAEPGGDKRALGA